jgi:hypothetical protein
VKVEIDPNEEFNGTTLNQAIVDAAADILAQHVIDSAGTGLDKLVAETRETEVRRQVAPLVEETIQGPIQQTNSYGQPTGKPTTLKALVVDKALEALSEPVGRSYRYVSGQSISEKDTRSLVEYFVARYVRSELENQIKKIAGNVVKVTEWGNRLSEDIENSIIAGLEDTAKRLKKARR